MILKADTSQSGIQDSSSESSELKQENKHLEGFYEELPIVKEIIIENTVSVSVRKCPETAQTLLNLETDLTGDVVVHWGVCRDDSKNWEIPAEPYPPETIVFKNKALRTLLQVSIELYSLAMSFSKSNAEFLLNLPYSSSYW